MIEKSRIMKIVKASLMLAVFFIMSTLGFKRYDNFQLKKTDDADEGFKVAKMKIQIGSTEAHGVCGSSYSCTGGSGTCGSSYNCTGGGGTCGSSYNCTGGGGVCGSSYNCAGQ